MGVFSFFVSYFFHNLYFLVLGGNTWYSVDDSVRAIIGYDSSANGLYNVDSVRSMRLGVQLILVGLGVGGWNVGVV